MNENNSIQLLIIIPQLKNHCYYYINEAEQKHFCTYIEIQNIIKKINSCFFLKIQYFLDRMLPFVIDFNTNEIKELKYNNNKELLDIKNHNYIKTKDELQKIKRESDLNNIDNLYYKTEKLNRFANKINRHYDQYYNSDKTTD
jgi:hypothetical protein